jgi:DNA-binding Lrp family transcriptional regulator
MRYIDGNILSALDFHARDSLRKIAKRLRMKKETLAYHIRRLKKEGVLKGFYIVPDTTKLGLTSFKVMIKYQNIDVETEKKLLNDLINTPEIGWVVKCDGTYDLMFICWVKSAFEFEKIFAKIMNAYSQFFYSRDMVILTENHARRHTYLSHKKMEDEEVVYRGEPKNICDETDLKLLEILKKDAREECVAMAQKIGLTPEAIVYRIKQLIKKGVITAFRPRIDLKKIGYYYYNIMFRLRSISAIPKIFSYLAERRNVSYYTRYIGSYDIGVDVEIESPEKFRQLLEELREKFGEHIINYDYVLIYDELKISY